MNVEHPEPSAEEAARIAAARDVLMKLDKAIRMRRFYDANHDLVRRFEGDLVTTVRAFFESHGEFSIRVRPTSFEVSSLPIKAAECDEFALSVFRQGIIALRFQTALGDDELVRFIELCATGLHAGIGETDDLPTLLWRGNLTHIQYAAPVGYTEDDGSLRSEDDLFVDQESVSQVIGESLMIDFDRLPPETRKAYEARVIKLKGNDDELPAELLRERSAVASETTRELARRTFEVVRSVVSMRSRGPDLSADDIRRLFLHFRKLFIDFADIEGLVSVAEATHQLLESPTSSAEDKASLQTMLEQRLDEKELTEMLARVPGGTVGNLDKVATLLRVFGGNDRAMIARLADLDESDAGRSALEHVLVEVAGSDPEFLSNRFRGQEGKRAVETLVMLAQVDIAQARMAVAVRLPAASDETQLALLDAVHLVPDLLDARMQTALIRLASKGEPLRGRILESFAVHPSAATAIREATLEWVKDPDFDEWGPKTVEAAFRVIVLAGAIEPVMPLFTQILERKSIFGRKQLVELKLAVVTALTASDEPEAHALLQRHGEGKDKDLAETCREALERIAAERARGSRPVKRGGGS